jgi:hypothetical protein
MATGPLNPTKHLTRQGIDHKMIYAAVVVDDNDPRQACRVRVRITGIHADTLPDNVLPWALPMLQGYATNGDTVERSGEVDIPHKGSKVGVRFPTGDVYKPMLAPYPGDKKTILPEAVTNYPFRKVRRYRNGASVVTDTKTNELFVINPGDMHMVIIGDCTKTIVGKSTEIVTGAKTDIPAYLLNASDFKINEIQAKSAGGAKFAGSGGAGSKYERITGDFTQIIEGNRTVKVLGNDNLNVGRSRTEDISGNHTINSTRSDTN